MPSLLTSVLAVSVIACGASAPSPPVGIDEGTRAAKAEAAA